MYKISRESAEKYMAATMNKANTGDPLNERVEELVTPGESRDFYEGFASALQLSFEVFENVRGNKEAFALAIRELIGRASNFFID